MSKFFSFVFSCIVIAGITFNVASAQNESRRITLTPMVSDVLDLPLIARNALQQKLTQMVLQNGMANQDGDFVLTASLSVLEKEVTPTAPPQYAVKIEVMTYVVNLLDDIVVAENTFTIKGVDSNENKALLRAINQINSRSDASKSFIATARENIINYYSDKAEALMLKANSLAKAGQFNEALATLEPIPECVPSYSEVSVLKDQIFSQWVDTEAVSYITEAKSNMALGNYEQAYNSLLCVNPLSSKFPEVQTLSNEIDKRIIAAEKAATAAKIREQETAVAIAQAESAAKIKEKEAEIAQANANAEAAKAATAWANASQAQSNTDAANAQAAISQAQLQTLKQLKGKMSKLSSDAQKAIVDNAFKAQTQYTYVAQAVSVAKPAQTLQEKTESLKKFLLGKMYKA